MPTPAPPSDLDDAIRDYMSGISCNDAAARHHTSYNRLRDTLKATGAWRTYAESRRIATTKISQTQRARSTVPWPELIADYQRGQSMLALSKTYNVARSSIELRLREAGVRIRGRQEVNRAMADARTPEENRAITAAAHAANRGRPATPERLANAATTREQRCTNASESEHALACMLRDRGLNPIQQKAIGPYNVDIAAGTVAVEVFGGGWHGHGLHARRAPKRLRYILNQGWNLVIVWDISDRWPLSPGAADYVVSFAEQTSSDPTIRGEYRVIWGDGKPVPLDGVNVDDLTFKPTRGRGFGARPGNNDARQ